MADARPIRIGGQTSFSAPSVMAPFEYAVAHRFDAFEWFPDRRPDGQGWLETDIAGEAREAIRQTARAHDIALSVHAAWQASPLTPEGRDCLARQARFAADIAASIFIVHVDADADPRRFLEALWPLIECLAVDRIRLALENTPATTTGELNALFRLMDRFAYCARLPETGEPAPRPGLCLDVGHANLCAETRHDYLAYVDRLSAEVPIAHLHLHENWGDEDSHLTLFTGPAARDAAGVEGLVDRLQRRMFAGCIILEQWPDPPVLLDRARDRLAAIIAARRGAGPTSASPPSP